MVASNYSLSLMQREAIAPRLDVPWRIADDPRRIEVWDYCKGVRERWDAWEADMVRLGLIEDTRHL